MRRLIIAATSMALHKTINMVLRTFAEVSFAGFFFDDFLFNGNKLKDANTSKPKPHTA